MARCSLRLKVLGFTFRVGVTCLFLLEFYFLLAVCIPFNLTPTSGAGYHMIYDCLSNALVVDMHLAWA